MWLPGSGSPFISAKMNKEVEIAINTDYNKNVETFQCLAKKHFHTIFVMNCLLGVH
jgi:hypothetical protein